MTRKSARIKVAYDRFGDAFTYYIDRRVAGGESQAFTLSSVETCLLIRAIDREVGAVAGVRSFFNELQPRPHLEVVKDGP